MLLSEILTKAGISPGVVADREITGVTCSSAQVIPGSLFFALKGEKTDGHLFIDDAMSKGAVAAVGENPDFRRNGYLMAANSRQAYALSCAAFWGSPHEALKLCGVTGTNGKTTVANMVRSICLSAGTSCGLIGTVENIAGNVHIEAERTTPGPEELYSLLRKMVDAGDKLCAMEVSSHSLAMDRVYGMEFDVGVFTNLTQDHLDYHKTMEAYAQAKAKLMEMSKISVINADDPAAELFMNKSRKVVTYGIDKPSDLMARNICCEPDRLSFSSPIGEVCLQPGGRFSVRNALAAMGAALNLGISEKDVLKGINSFSSVSGRLEKVPTAGEYSIYIDYAHTPDGLENVLKALKEFARKRIITVFGCGGDRDKTKRPIMGEIASRLSDFCVVTSDNPRTEDPLGIISDIVKGLVNENYLIEENRKEAIRKAMLMAEPGDIILLAGKGHETYQIIGTTKHHLDERELVAEIEAELSKGVF